MRTVFILLTVLVIVLVYTYVHRMRVLVVSGFIFCESKKQFRL
jgi:hypothetical protein